MPTITITGPSDRLIKAPSGLRTGKSFKSASPHVEIDAGGLKARKIDAHKPVMVSDAEAEVLTNAGIQFRVESP